MKQISLYKFGGNEDQSRNIQKPFVDFFRQSGPVLDIGCSHVIEHMAHEDAMAFLELCHQTLRPGGKLLLTPNPEDLRVISEIFWLDPPQSSPVLVAATDSRMALWETQHAGAGAEE